MKLKQWLREQKQMSYTEYKALPDVERWSIEGEHKRFCRSEQIHANQQWRPMTEEEKKKSNEDMENESKRYETSIKAGGIDERGNYTALHYR